MPKTFITRVFSATLLIQIMFSALGTASTDGVAVTVETGPLQSNSPQTSPALGRVSDRKETESLNAEEIQDFPVYPNIVGSRPLELPGLHTKEMLYETPDLMEDVVAFFEKELGMEYRVKAYGTVEFILGKKDLEYTFESPSYGRPELEKRSTTEQFEVPFKGIIVRYKPDSDSTEVITCQAATEEAIRLWRKSMRQQVELRKRGPRLYDLKANE